VKERLSERPCPGDRYYDPQGIIRLEPLVFTLQAYTYFSSKYPSFAQRYQEALEQLRNNVAIAIMRIKYLTDHH
jgi:hypothetical protein